MERPPQEVGHTAKASADTDKNTSKEKQKAQTRMIFLTRLKCKIKSRPYLDFRASFSISNICQNSSEMTF